jgi:hypothetical protein
LVGCAAGGAGPGSAPRAAPFAGTRSPARRLTFCPLLPLLPLLQANPAEAFSLWQATHGKSYKSAGEGARRQAVFADNAGRVAAQNARTDSSLRLALNQYADLTWQEFAQSRLGYNPALR